MRTIKIYCKTCGIKLTSELTEISEIDLCWEQNKDIMAENNFSIVSNLQTNEKSLFVSINDYNLKDHSDTSRFQGCCGSAPSNGWNKVCLNDHEVATEVSDCCTTHYIGFNLSKVIVKMKIEDNLFKELKL
jgi:hypothetical protein